MHILKLVFGLVVKFVDDKCRAHNLGVEDTMVDLVLYVVVYISLMVLLENFKLRACDLLSFISLEFEMEFETKGHFNIF